MLSRWHTVNCDNCGDAGPLTEKPSEATAAARDAGWKLAIYHLADGQPHRGEDLCPKCKERNEP